MARIRTIKPEFWRDEDLSGLPAETALLAIGLLNHADDEDDDSRFRSTGGAAEWSAAGWSAAKSRDDRTSSLANTR